jgi:hypothetical protein
MIRRSGRLVGALAFLCVPALADAAQAEDFFSALFGGPFAGRQLHAPSMSSPFASEREPNTRASSDQARPRFAGGQAYCVRTCDGRYFPISAVGNESRAAVCNNFCPASETKLVYGSSIDSAATEAGKPYSELPNAFRYRDEIVAGCTCNGKDPVELASIKVENDPTLRKGDLVAAANRLMVTGRSAGQRGTSLNFSPAPRWLSARYQRGPVVASGE